LFLFILIIIFAFSSRAEAEGLRRESPGSGVNAAHVPQTEKTNNDSGKHADQIRALVEKLAELYRELQIYIEQYRVIRNELRDAKEAYAEDPSSQNLKRLEHVESDMREILGRIETLKSEIDDLEDNVVPR
jgi:chromosome segregation ATPase